MISKINHFFISDIFCHLNYFIIYMYVVIICFVIIYFVEIHRNESLCKIIYRHVSLSYQVKHNLRI